MVETQRYNYQRPRELVSSASFSIEYSPQVTDRELRDDIISYLGEFRFGLQKYDYQLIFSPKQGEGWKLRDPHRLEAMGVKAKRSIDERRMRGDLTTREEAENVGITFLEKQLENAEEGDTIVWASPPGSSEEGYGNYGFFFIGQVARNVQTRKDIEMTAVRVENPTIAKYSRAFQILSGVSFDFRREEDFIKNPVVIGGSLPRGLVDATLSEIFITDADPSQKTRFEIAMKMMESKIQQFIVSVRWASAEEKKKEFHALENYALYLKKELEKGEIVYESEEGHEIFVAKFGYEPPQVKGSCPITSSNLFAKVYGSLNNLLAQEWFTCPKCGYKADGPVGDTCPGCGLTKQAWAQESGVVCE